MKKNIFIFLILGSIGFAQLCSAQHQNKIDSLLHVLKRAREDTNKVKTQLILSDQYYKAGDQDNQKIYAENALQLAKKIKDKKWEAKAHRTIGNIYSNQGEYAEALKTFFVSVKIYEAIGYKSGIADNYIDIGVVYCRQGNFPEALKTFLSSLNLYEEAGNKSGIAGALNSLGNVYADEGNYPKALEHYFKALKIDEELVDKSGIAIKLANIGLIYSNQGDYAKALAYFFKALKMDEELADQPGIAIDLGNIGIVYYNQGDYPKALDYYFKALKMAEQLGSKYEIANWLGNIGLVYYHQGDFSKALDYYFKALKMTEELGDKGGIARHLGKIGAVYKTQGDYSNALDYYFKALKLTEELGDKVGIASLHCSIGSLYTKNGQFVKAEAYLKKAIAINDSIGAMYQLCQCEKSLSQLYDTTGRYQLALEHYKKAMVIKDTIFNQEKNKENTRNEMNYEFEKTQAVEKAGHEKQMAVAAVEIKKQTLLKNSFIGGLTLALVLFFFIYNNYRTKQKLKLETIRNNIAADLHDDIGSTLNSISIYSEVARKNDKQQDEALEMIGNASRNIIDAMSDIVWTINPDNDSFAKIIFRMKSLAYNLFRAKKIEFTFHADENLNEKKLSLEERKNFYLIFKEAVNNLVKYSNANRAAITLTNENEYVKLLIQDDGIGFDMSADTAGNGLKNMKRRADEINARFKLESKKGNGTQIELILKS